MLSQVLREAALADGELFCLGPDLDAVTAEVSSSGGFPSLLSLLLFLVEWRSCNERFWLDIVHRVVGFKRKVRIMTNLFTDV
eukprot:11308056-Ditylum_brightwellii.AAC.1